MDIGASRTVANRVRLGLGLAAGIAAFAAANDAAFAQYYPAPAGAYHGYYGGAPPLPPEGMDVADDQSDLVAPPPLPPAPPPYEDRQYSPYPPAAAPPEPQVYGRALPAPQSPAPYEVQQPGAARPPADVASIPSGQAQSGAGGALPPEYQAEQGSPKELPPILRRQEVFYPTKEPAGTIVIDTPNTYLYLVLGNNQAIRYGIGVGREGFTWSGREKITRVAEWPDWTPPPEMIERQPYLPRFMAGGPSNPLGARALYLGNTVYRIHGTNQPSTIGSFVSSGCIRLTNEDIMDLYKHVKVGTKVVVLPGPPSHVSASNQTNIAH
jgi:lipoprotein-anchoring transpeptidase ErfK/SrfK